MEPIHDTLGLIEEICENCIVGFNLTYDWFHLCQTATILDLLATKYSSRATPFELLKEYIECEPLARDGKCYKPRGALDLMLYARRGPYQSTMDRKSIRLRRVPKVLAQALVSELEKRIKFKDIYFAKRRKKNVSRWTIYPIKYANGELDPQFVDIGLKFQPASSLKAICLDAGIRAKDRLLFQDVEPTEMPLEVGWAPFALAISNFERRWLCKVGSKRGVAWPGVIEHHIDHWRYRASPRKYAAQDVEDTRNLYYHFDQPEVNDNDSILACMVGASRWRGFKIDIEKLKELREVERKKMEGVPKAPHRVYGYLAEVMSDLEKAALKDRNGKPSTKKVILEEISKWENHPAGERAAAVLDARKGHNKNTLFSKLIQAGRLHASSSVIGSLSSRMSGRTEVGDGKRAAGLNALGIQRDKNIRACFPLAFDGYTLAGGDFDAYEIAIADAEYNDENLRRELLTCYACKYICNLDEYQLDYCVNCGKVDTDKDPHLRKLHGLFSMSLNPGKTYEDIIATKGQAVGDLYDQGKRGVFSQLYGGDENTLVERLGIELEKAHAASVDFQNRYQGVKRSRLKVFEDFCSMRQPGGIGTRVEWHEPKDYIESLNGFPRYFTLENDIARALFALAENPPKPWTQIQLRVMRREREQTVTGAVRSAILAAAFQIQAQNMRAAANHRIQSTGAIETKALQVELWNLQPCGVHEWLIQPLNIHDELMTPVKPEIAPKTSQIVSKFIESRRQLIPLIKMKWHTDLTTWADK